MTASSPISQKLSLFVIALIGILYHFISTYGYTMDDALITLRYSLNFGTSGLPIWNQADVTHPTMGFTSPLWMVINSIQVLFTDNKDTIVIVSKFWSLAFLLAFTYFIVSIIQEQQIPFLKKSIYTALLLWNPVFAFHVSSGMETIFFSSALSLYAILIIRFENHYKVLIGFGLLLFFIRPEGILALGVFWTYDLFVKRDYKKSFLSALIIWSILLSYFYAVYSFYGYPLPSAFYVKQGGGSLLKAAAIKMTAVFILLSALPFIINIIAQYKHIQLKKEFFILAFLSIFFLFYLTVEPLMNIIYRYQMPLLFLLTLFFALHLKTFDSLPKVFQYFIIAYITFLIIFNTGLSNKYASKVSQADDNLRTIGLFFKEHTNQNDWLTYHDAGYVCYYSDINSIDSMGLNTIDIAIGAKTYIDYLKDEKLTYVLQNGQTNDLNEIDTSSLALEHGFEYLGAIPMSYDGIEYYVVKVYQRNGSISSEQLSTIQADIKIRKTWFDDLYYFGRNLIKNR